MSTARRPRANPKVPARPASARPMPAQASAPALPTRTGHPAAPAPAARPAAPPRGAGFRHRNLPLLLLQARESVISRFRPILHAHGLTEQQWRIVRALLDIGPLEPRQIGEVCRISSPSLAGVLARMDDLGLVQRERLAHDQRRVMVALTAHSRTLAAQMAPQIEAAYQAIEAHIGADFIGRFYDTLDELIGLLGELPDAGT